MTGKVTHPYVSHVSLAEGQVDVVMANVDDDGPSRLTIKSEDRGRLAMFARHMIEMAADVAHVVPYNIRRAALDAMDDLDQDTLDPGIRGLVVVLRGLGFATTDSGDGVSKPEAERDMNFPHVACQVPTKDMLAEADRLQRFLDSSSFASAGWTVDATYYPASRRAILFAYVNDSRSQE